MEQMVIRPIQLADNTAMASIIRNTLDEFGIGKRPGTAYYDTATDDMYASFQDAGSRYNVALLNNRIAGGCGIYPSPELPEYVCEMVKVYLAADARGLGIGRQLIEESLTFARQYGYRRVYIESMPELQKAMSVYEKFGFRYLQGPMGNTGHYNCTIWMLKEL